MLTKARNTTIVDTAFSTPVYSILVYIPPLLLTCNRNFLPSYIWIIVLRVLLNTLHKHTLDLIITFWVKVLSTVLAFISNMKYFVYYKMPSFYINTTLHGTLLL
jgi:hypothetical protein